MHRVFVDANVLGSKTQYDWLFMLKVECYMYAVVTSQDVLDEAHRVWRLRYPAMDGSSRRRREEHFQKFFDDILSEWPGGEVASLKDINDAHVYNAAAAAGADVLLTNNAKDFGDSAELPFDVYTPDEFYCLVAANSPNTVREVTLKQAMYWNQRLKTNPDSPPKRLDEALQKAGCPKFALVVAENVKVLSGLTASG
ncbi:PIN domain-containing protein [Aeromicrobium phragmitis]|uniref:PIN domain-containing protein n=1 Tax=Aeromicrobium phragmitis TaxID=2478914 RepID=A0A3L8PHH1_9ACTN|nr:PIN domain-containing protein [Aeromicrobium phragmitis]RLV54534.1 PIN domain-containing protein [Aeromicrobium phragmitis]